MKKKRSQNYTPPRGHAEARIETNKTEQYRTLAKNLEEIDTDGVELLIENMPPNPWYFGGQWFNSVFLNPQEIDQFCKDLVSEFVTIHLMLCSTVIIRSKL